MLSPQSSAARTPREQENILRSEWNHGWKNFEKQKTIKTRREWKQKAGPNPFCDIRDHFDPFDGALSSHKFLAAFRIDVPVRAAIGCRVLFRPSLDPKGFSGKLCGTFARKTCLNHNFVHKENL